MTSSDAAAGTGSKTMFTWRSPDGGRLEQVRLKTSGGRLRANGRIIAAATDDVEAYSVSYELVTNDIGVTRRFSVRVRRGDGDGQLEVSRDLDGKWMVQTPDTIVHSERELAAAIEAAACFDRDVLVERYIAGQEVSVAVLGDRPLGAVEIAPKTDFYDYGAKYTRGQTNYFLPPRLSPERYRGVLAMAARASAALGCRGATRVDMIVSDAGNEYLLEVNTVPGMTPTSLLPKIAAAAGIEFGELCEAQLYAATLPLHRNRGERRIAQRGFDGDDRRAAPIATH